MVKKRNRSVTAKYVLLFGILLLLTNIILALVMYSQSRKTVLELLRKNMVSISNTAAGLMDGDLLESFTEDDVGSPAWNSVIDELTVFQDNIDIEYIYTVHQVGPEEYAFIVDPDPVNPGEFGEDVVVTDALISAGNGVASVDTEAAQDEWGNFYSSYSPVFDSEGKVAAIVGVDFDSQWYESQIREHMLPSIFIIMIFLVICIGIVVLFSQKMLKRLRRLNSQLYSLNEDVDNLIADLSSEVNVLTTASAGNPDNTENVRNDGLDRVSGAVGVSGAAGTNGATGVSGVAGASAAAEASGIPATKMEKPLEDGDEISILSSRLQMMQDEIKKYQSFSHERACMDALTRVRNTTAYAEMQEQLNIKIQDGTADFHVIVLDINDLKKINDQYGHITGDEIIRSAARSISAVFGPADTYRIGGDEFLAITEQSTEETIKEKMLQLDETVSAYNTGRKGATLSLAKGIAVFQKDKDASFQDVFIRADEDMYKNKQIFHAGRS